MRACDTIEYLRWQLKQADEELACKTLHIPQLKGRRQQLHSVYKKVQLNQFTCVEDVYLLQMKLMATVTQAESTVKLLIANSDFAGALHLINSTQQVLNSELAGIQSLM